MYPGDTVTAIGTLKSTANDMATYEVAVRNQDGTEVITGEATVPLA